MKPEFWWSVDCAQGQRFRTTTREGVNSHTNNITVLVTIPLTASNNQAYENFNLQGNESSPPNTSYFIYLKTEVLEARSKT